MHRLLLAALAALLATAAISGALASVTGADGSGAVVLNGQKVFPIVLAKGPDASSTTRSGSSAFAEVASGGVTFLKLGPATTPWTQGDIADASAQDRAAAANGLSTWVNLSTVSQATAGSPSDTLLQQVVSSLESDAGGTAVGLWKGADEPFWSGISPAGLQFAYCRSTGHGDPAWCGGEPVLESDHQWVTIEAPRGTASQLAPYSDVTDIHGVDVYPVTLQSPTGDLHAVGAWTSTVASITPSHRVWTTLQVCSSGSYDTTGRYVLPTFAQERYMVYDAIINGAHSLAFYGGNIAGCWNATDRQYGWNWTFWSTVLKPLLTEINASAPLAPALVNASTTQTLPTSDPSTEAVSRSGAGNELWVIAARRGAATTGVTIGGLPTTVSTGTVYTEGRSIPVTNGSFTDDFAQWSVHVYRFVPDVTTTTTTTSTTPASPPSGGGGGGGGSVPNLAVSLAPSASQTQPGGLVDVTVHVENTGGAGSLQTHLRLTLPDALKLVGTPYYESGSGCTGAESIDCFLDYVPNGGETRVLFEVRAADSGRQTIVATVSADLDSDLGDNTAAVTLEVATPPVTPAPAPPKPHAAANTFAGTANVFAGTAKRDLITGTSGADVIDRLFGGPGNDRLESRDGQRDVVDCGPGHDTAIVDRLDRVSACEIVRRGR